MENLRVHGFWWLPHRQDHKVPGVLEFGPEVAGKLTLVGALSNILDAVPEEPIEGGGTRKTVTVDILDAHGAYGRIHGQSGNKAYTLDNCFEMHSSAGLGSEPHEQIVYVNRVFEGVWYEVGEELSGDSVTFGAHGLVLWTGRSGVSDNLFAPADPGNPDVVVEGRNLESDAVKLVNGSSLVLRHHLVVNDVAPGLSVNEDFFLSVEYPTIQGADDLLDVASDIQDLVSIGIDRPAAFGQVSLSHPDLYKERPGRHTGEAVTVYAAWTAVGQEQSKLGRHDLLFTLEDLGGLPTVVNWMEVAAVHREALGRVMATRYAKRMYVSDRFLNRAAALEGFDRVETGRGRGRTFATRLSSCTNLAGQPFTELVHNPRKWIRELVDHRNEIAHHYGRRMREATEEQVYLADSAYWLFVFCMLRKADAPQTVFERICNDQRLVFLKRRLARFLT